MTTIPGFVQVRSNWEISSFIRSFSNFGCAECKKYNNRRRVEPVNVRGTGIVAMSQCQWCGVYNAFVKNGYYLTWG